MFCTPLFFPYSEKPLYKKRTISLVRNGPLVDVFQFIMSHQSAWHDESLVAWFES